MVDKLVGSMVEEMARAMEAASENEVPYWNGILLRKLAQACAAIAQKRVNELEAVRPLETAPKDGSYFLMVGSNFDGGMAVVQWDAGLEWWTLDDGKNPEIALRHESGLVGWLPLPRAALPTMLKGNGDG